MKKHLNKLASSAAGVGLFLIGGAAAGLGLVVVFYLAIFALAAAGLGLLAAPLLRLTRQASDENAEEVAC